MFLSLVSLARAAPIDQSFEYDAINRLTVAGPATHPHDAAGNLVEMTAAATIVLFKANKSPIWQMPEGAMNSGR
jgi:hypothetical protein